LFAEIILFTRSIQKKPVFILILLIELNIVGSIMIVLDSFKQSFNG